MRPPRNTGSRTIWSWALYDFANSAYILTTATAVLPLYFSGVIVPQNGARILGQTLEAPTIWGLLVGAAALAIFILAPILGAVADASGRARTLLGLFALGGASAGLGVSQSGPGDVLWAASLFILAQVCFAGANVFYDAFLPRIAAPEDRDRVSGLGFAAGYLGGGLQFAISLGLISGRDALGLTFAQAAQWSMALAAAWWAVFTLPSLAGLPRPAANLPRPDWPRLLTSAAAQTRNTLRTLTRDHGAGRFLLAFVFYNDGIQTIIAMAAIFGRDELGLEPGQLMLTMLLIQGVAIAGSLGFSRLAVRLGTKTALTAALLVWSGVVCLALFIQTGAQYMVLGGLVGLVLGGSQALSRSLFASLLPVERAAEYFGYYAVVSKLSAVGGPLIFAAVRHFTGSSRSAVGAVLILFVAGLLLLKRVPGREPAA